MAVRNKKVQPVRIAEQNADFAASMPTIQGATALDRKAKGFIIDKFYDLGDYIFRAGQMYVDACRTQYPETHFVFDYHVGEPNALIGGTFVYDWRTRSFNAWIWTEQPDKVDAMTLDAARAESKEVINKLY